MTEMASAASVRRLGAVLLLLPLALSAQTKAPEPNLTVALTFDDLPIAGPGVRTSEDAIRLTDAIVGTLKRYGAAAIGFVNEAQLDGQRGRELGLSLLRKWADAGFSLGNHTYSHPDLNALTIERFKEEIVRGEPAIRELMAKRGEPLFFRHPMTHTGDTTEKKNAIDAFLIARGYRIAPHTIENSDFIFNVVYARALDANDTALATRVREAYIEFTFATTAFAQQLAPQIFGHDIPHTLLLHANKLNADTLGELLTGYRSRGYAFITLQHAMADPSYATPDTMVSSSGPTWLWRWARSLGKKVSGKDDPEPPAWVAEAYKRCP